MGLTALPGFDSSQQQPGVRLPFDPDFTPGQQLAQRQILPQQQAQPQLTQTQPLLQQAQSQQGGNSFADVFNAASKQFGGNQQQQDSSLDRKQTALEDELVSAIGKFANELDPDARLQRKGGLALAQKVADPFFGTSGGFSEVDQFGQSISNVPRDIREKMNRGEPLTELERIRGAGGNPVGPRTVQDIQNFNNSPDNLFQGLLQLLGGGK